MAEIQLTAEYNSFGGVGGTCALCNASKRQTDRAERIITTNMLTDMQDAPPGVWPEKWFEVCESCVEEMAHLLGMKTGKEADSLTHQINQLIDERDDLQEQLQANIKLLDAATYAMEQFGRAPIVKDSALPVVGPAARKR